MIYCRPAAGLPRARARHDNLERGDPVITIYALGIGLAFGLAITLTPVVRALSVRKGLMDVPNRRKIHERPVPRLGGVAIFMAVLLPLLLVMPLTQETQGFLIGLGLLATLGLMDDVRGLDARSKIPVQMLAAWMLVVFGGVRIQFLEMPGLGEWVFAEWFANLATVLCVIALINAMNLLDGLDGLAGGTAAIVFASISVLGLSTGNSAAVAMSVIFMGATLGFLWFNRHPASIFMGDTGSMILGFGLAYGCLKLVFGQPHVVSTWVPFGLLALPIFDTGWAFARRIWNGKSPFSPDRTHIHHRLLRSGISHSQAVLALNGLTGLLCLQTVVLARGNGSAIAGLTVVTLVLFSVLLRWLQLPGVHAVRIRAMIAARSVGKAGKPG